MKKTTAAVILTTMILAVVPLAIDRSGFNAGTPAFALCIASEIRNNCCFKFKNSLEGGATASTQTTRELNAVAEFKRCLRADIGCSMEFTEMKSKDAAQIRQICR